MIWHFMEDLAVSFEEPISMDNVGDVSSRHLSPFSRICQDTVVVARLNPVLNPVVHHFVDGWLVIRYIISGNQNVWLMNKC